MKKTEEFFRKINNAFAEGDHQFLLDSVTPQFVWVVVGEKTFCGKSEFSEALKKMKEMPPMKIEIQRVLIDDLSGIVEGIVVGRNRTGQKKEFGFCDIYRLEDDQHMKIKEMTSYVIDVSKHKQYREGC